MSLVASFSDSKQQAAAAAAADVLLSRSLICPSVCLSVCLSAHQLSSLFYSISLPGPS